MCLRQKLREGFQLFALWRVVALSTLMTKFWRWCPVSFFRDRCFDVSNQARGCCISGSAAKPISVLGLYRRQNDSHCGMRMIITKVTRPFQEDKNQYGGDCFRKAKRIKGQTESVFAAVKSACGRSNGEFRVVRI